MTQKYIVNILDSRNRVMGPKILFEYWKNTALQAYLVFWFNILNSPRSFCMKFNVLSFIKFLLLSLSEPCRRYSPGYTYPMDGVCSGFWTCFDRKSLPACCIMGHRFKQGQGCVTDPTCVTPCAPRQGTVTDQLQGTVHITFNLLMVLDAFDHTWFSCTRYQSYK